MAQLRQDYERLRQHGIEVLVVGPEDRQAFAEYFAQEKLPFTGLPDPQHRVLKLYGQEVSLFKFGRQPAQVLVDRDGMVRFAYYGKAMNDIPDSGEILAAIENELEFSSPS